MMAGKKGRPGGNHGGGKRPGGQPWKARISITLRPDLLERLPSAPLRSKWIEEAIEQRLEREREGNKNGRNNGY